MKRIYIAGPMTGLPDYNYPAFNAAAAEFRAAGWHVENPAEGPKRDSWEGYMRNAITQLVTCDAIHLLPGWDDSRGALLEQRIAYELALEFVSRHRAGHYLFGMLEQGAS